MDIQDVGDICTNGVMAMSENNTEKSNRQSTSSIRQLEELVKMAAAYCSDIGLLQAEVKQLRGESTKF